MPSNDKLLYVFSRAPYSTSSGQEGLDASLVGAAFDCTISVLFIHDGVFQLLKGQNCEATQLKQYTKAFSALQDFGIEKIYLHDLSSVARGIEVDQLIQDVELVNTAQVSDIIAQQHRVFTF